MLRPVSDALHGYLEANKQRCVRELVELCAIPCEASDPAALDAAATWCRDRLASAGCSARILRVVDAPALVVGETGSGKRTLVGVQHYDVQPAVPLALWQTPPYEPAVRDRAVDARGGHDHKGHPLLPIPAIETHRAGLRALAIQI